MSMNTIQPFYQMSWVAFLKLVALMVWLANLSMFAAEWNCSVGRFA